MHVYKISFALNQIATITLSDSEHSFKGDLHYYAHNGLLIFALCKAESEAHARIMAENLIRDFDKQKDI